MKKTSTIFKSYGEALKWALDRRGFSQVWLSEKTGIAEETISKYKTGDFNPPRKRRRMRFDELLGVKIEKQSDDKWIAFPNKDVDEAFKAVNEAEEISNADTDSGQDRDEIDRDLELAEKLIRRCRELL